MVARLAWPLILLWAGAPLWGDVLESGILTKGQVYTQTADNEVPSRPEGFLFLSEIVFSEAGAATSVNLEFGEAGSLMQDQGEGYWRYFDFLFTSKEAFDSEYPSEEEYRFTYSGGTLGPGSLMVYLGEDRYPDAPYFTGTVWSDTQQYDPAREFLFEWNEFTPGANGGYIRLLIEKEGPNGYETEHILDAGATGFLVGAGTLSPFSDYIVDLAFINYDNESEDDSDLSSAYFSLTWIEFSTIPEPGAFMLFSLGGLLLLWRLRRGGL